MLKSRKNPIAVLRSEIPRRSAEIQLHLEYQRKVKNTGLGNFEVLGKRTALCW